MRVCHVVSGLGVGGAEVALYRLVGAMEGADTLVVSVTSDGPIGDRLRRSGVPVAVLNKRRGVPDPRAVWRLRRRLREFRPDVVHTWMYEANLYGLLAARLARVPRVVWSLRCSNMLWSRYGRLAAVGFRLGALLSWAPDAILVNSYAGAQHHARNGYRTHRMRVIQNGFDTATFRPSPRRRQRVRRALGLADGVPLVGMVARVDPMKDHALLAAAAARVRRRFPGAHFLLVGAGTDEQGRLADLLGSRDPEGWTSGRWRLLGARDDVPEILCALDLLALASLGEGFPNVVGEAMACAVPCVATDVGDAARLVGPTGRLTPLGDPAAFAEALVDLLAMAPAERRALGRAARSRVVKRFRLQDVAARHADLYRSLLHGASRPRSVRPSAGPTPLKARPHSRP